MVIINFLDRLPRAITLALGVVLLVLLGILDYVTSPDISILYLLPVSFVTWYNGRLYGAIIAVASIFISIVSGLSGVPLANVDPLILYWDELAKLGVLLVVNYMVAELKNALMREKELARTDYLTGVANGRFFMELASLEINRARRYAHPLSIAFVDLDDFKLVNDLYGHSAGDTLLRLVAQTIKSHMRSSDVVARMGGDEFTILLPETGRESAQPAIRKLQSVLMETIQKEKYPITFSIGVVTFEQPPQTVDEMIQQADDVMYTVKNSGKNQIRFHVVAEPAKVVDIPI